MNAAANRALVGGVFALALSACGDTGPARPATSAAPVATFRLAPDAIGSVPTIGPFGKAAQIALVLGGERPSDDDLIAEIASEARPDDVRRWPVDEPPADATAATLGAVVVPPYALPTGAYALTVWRGDAEVVARYRFRVP